MLSGLMAVSTFTIISVARMLVGIMVKFSPFLNRVVSALLSVLVDRLTTQFVWSTLGVEVDLHKEELLKFLFLSLFGVLEDSLGVGTDLF